MPQSYIYIIQTLKILKANIDNKSDNKPNTLKQVIHHFN